MPSFGKASKSKLETCHPDLQKVMNEAIKYFDFTVLYGTRTVAEQQKLFKVGRKKNPDGTWKVIGKTVTNLDGVNKKSKHNYTPSKAIDIAPYPIDWDDIDSFKEMAQVVKNCAINLGIKITYGGDWKMRDYPHFEVD